MGRRGRIRRLRAETPSERRVHAETLRSGDDRLGWQSINENRARLCFPASVRKTSGPTASS